jgi:chitinase
MTLTTRITLLTLMLSLGLSVDAGPPTFDVTVTANGDGYVVLDPSGPYKRNNIVNVTAVANEGSVFDHWEGDLSGDVNPTILRISSDHQITAVFVEEGSGSDPGGGDPGGGGTDRPALPDRGMLISYFTSWSVYRRAYYPGDIESSGAAERLDVINYAFAGIDENYRCAILDSFADYNKAFDAGETVDGIADSPSQSLKGNFNQLRKLKNMYPGLRVMISIGGWTESYRFSQMTASPASRAAFIESCIDMFVRGQVADGVDASGVFDGIDIDWEYPGRCGATCDYSDADPENFTALLSEFRTRLDLLEDEVEASAGTRPEYLLSIAAPAGQYYYEALQPELGQMQASLDWINIMAYDFHGGWETSGPANHHAPLYKSECDPATTADYGDKAVHAYLASGVPGNKLVLGVPFYGRGWRGVASVDDGLCQPARGIPRGTYEKGIDDYEVLVGSSASVFHEEDDSAAWTFDGSEFWSFDDETSLGTKARYVDDTGLRGVMSWDLSGDTGDAALVKALSDAFAVSSGGGL